MKFLGVDPGLSGALAIYDANPVDQTMHVIDMPVVITQRGKQITRQINEPVLSQWIKKHAGDLQGAMIEHVAARPGQGVTGMFRFGMAYGIVRGILAANSINYDLVTPTKWKRAMGLGKEKDEARMIAARLVPEEAEMFMRKKDADRAEAVLLAVYAWGGGQTPCGRITGELTE